MPSDATPTVVLVHGAFADASGWADVITAVTDLGYRCLAPANPLRGIEPDAAYLRDVLSTVEGPVVLVGHSYGGAVITNAATGNPAVKALVFVCAYAPDEGERLAEANTLGGDDSELGAHLTIRPYPGAPEGDGDAYIALDAFHRLFCADLEDGRAAVMAVSQRAVAASALFTPSGAPAWRDLPCWYLVGAQDGAIPPSAQRVMAARMDAGITEIDSSHVAMISNPKATTDVVLAALQSVE
jgi:pimeloyl-ACP methyl ester carboxylesterase